MTINVENVSFHSSLSPHIRYIFSLKKDIRLLLLLFKWQIFWGIFLGLFIWEQKKIFFWKDLIARRLFKIWFFYSDDDVRQNRNLKYTHIYLSLKNFGFFSLFVLLLNFMIWICEKKGLVENFFFFLVKLNYPISTSHIVHFNLLNCCAHTALKERES